MAAAAARKQRLSRRIVSHNQRRVLLRLDDRERDALLRAMAVVASAGGQLPLSDADRRALVAANRIVFAAGRELDPVSLASITPAELARQLRPEVAVGGLEFLTVMAVVDGELEARRLATLRGFAAALHAAEDYLVDLAEAARGHIAWAIADLSRKNVSSISDGHTVRLEDFPLYPYHPDGDAALLARLRGLVALPDGTLGREFLRWYETHHFALPGEPTGLNARFALPHDSLHLLSGYSTSPQGELLVSTFTAGAIGPSGFGAHILPVIFSFHLGLRLNDLAGTFHGALAPEKFWHAWERGAAMTVNCFAATWDFWRVAPLPLAQLQHDYGIPPLAPQWAAADEPPAGDRAMG